MQKNLNFLNENPSEISNMKLFSTCIQFLLILSIENKLKQNLEKIISLIDIKSLISKMQQIHEQIIAKRIFIVMQERICNHKNCQTKCDLNYLTIHDKSLIKTGFNIFILLTLFIESSPFPLNGFTDEIIIDMKRLNYLQKKMNKPIQKNKNKSGKVIPYNSNDKKSDKFERLSDEGSIKLKN